MMAFALYFILPPKEIDDKGKDVIRFAEAIGRTPSSAALKIWNIAANDENRIRQGKVGMPHGSKIDAKVWDWFRDRGDDFLNEATTLLASVFNDKAKQQGTITYTFINIAEGKEKAVEVNQRINQQYFRNTLLRNYQNRCCVTGLDVEPLLVASHIKPWSVADPKTERLAPSNGLLLNALHDRAFDKGLITIDKHYRIKVSSKLKGTPPVRDWIMQYRDESIWVPSLFPPSSEFIEYHNDMVFIA
jgi:putative restriction endonuclease